MHAFELSPALLGTKKALIADKTNNKLLIIFLAHMTLCLTIACSARNDIGVITLRLLYTNQSSILLKDVAVCYRMLLNLALRRREGGYTLYVFN